MTNRLPTDIAQKLLDHLIQDDGFRDLFESNPRSALSKLGYETPAADRGWKGRDPVLSLYHLQGGLASKEKLAASRDAFQAQSSLVAGSVPLPFQPFDACNDD